MQTLRLNYELNSGNWCICFSIHLRWLTSGKCFICNERKASKCRRTWKWETNLKSISKMNMTIYILWTRLAAVAFLADGGWSWLTGAGGRWGGGRQGRGGGGGGTLLLGHLLQLSRQLLGVNAGRPGRSVTWTHTRALSRKGNPHVVVHEDKEERWTLCSRDWCLVFMFLYIYSFIKHKLVLTLEISI